MARYHDRTAMGGQDGAFPVTCWTDIQAAGAAGEDQQRMMLDHLLGRYWKPVYCYVRRKGFDNERAKDLTQGFFSDIVLGRALLERADPNKGRFRTFLLTALDRYIIDIHRKETSAKRSPAQGHRVWEQVESSELPDSLQTTSPDQAFMYAWATDLLDEVLTSVERHCQASRQSQHWAVFQRRVLHPLFEETNPPSLETVCTELGINSPTQASNMIITVKRRFKSTLERHLGRMVNGDEQVQQELSELIRILALDSAGSAP